MARLIEDYALLGDTQTAALVGSDGSIDWLCFPRFDSGAIFAALLGTEQHGRWLIAPQAAVTATRRRYEGENLILETEFDTKDGTVRVKDFMPPRGEAPDVVRIVEGVAGRVPMLMQLRIRFDYGRVVPWVRREGGALAAVAGPDSCWLRTPVQTRGEDMQTVADFVVEPGDRVPFVLTWQESHLKPPQAIHAEHALRETRDYWSSWLAHCTYDGQWRDAVIRSLITLKALTYAPSGGIVAAPTTSLPEKLGGVRNWDYRFCWLRDATITLQALMYAGFKQEALAWRRWLLPCDRRGPRRGTDHVRGGGRAPAARVHRGGVRAGDEVDQNAAQSLRSVDRSMILGRPAMPLAGPVFRDPVLPDSAPDPAGCDMPAVQHVLAGGIIGQGVLQQPPLR